MSEREEWSEDVCTCRHKVSRHADGSGRCFDCAHDASWNIGFGRGATAPNQCQRYQWNGKERVRIW